MKKIVIRVLLVLLALVIGYLAFQPDRCPTESDQAGRAAGLAPEAFEKTNGYYRLWTLIEPRGRRYRNRRGDPPLPPSLRSRL